MHSPGFLQCPFLQSCLHIANKSKKNEYFLAFLLRIGCLDCVISDWLMASVQDKPPNNLI